MSRLLIEQGLQPWRIGHGKRITPGQWRGEPLIHFTRQLATLLQAGLPLVNTLQLLAAEHPSAAWRCLLRQLAEQVREGQPLSETLPRSQAFSTYLSPTDRHRRTDRQPRSLLPAAGTTTGSPADAAPQSDQSAAVSLFICAVALLVSVLMLVMVLPEFAKVYQSFDAPLPWFTQGLLGCPRC